MQKGLFFLTLLAVAGVTSCKEQTKQATEVVAEENEVIENIALVPEKWINNRVAKAKNKLQGSEAGKVIWNAMEAHGGLSKWYGNGALAFRFNYQPLDGKTARDSYQVVDTWRNRAVHTSVTDSTAKFGWDGKAAWVKAKDSTAFAYDTKFWALTPIYLFAHPFVLDGEGVNLELLPQATYIAKTNDVIKVTFDAGTGDAPDDYYILHFDTDTHLMTAIRYIVSYPAYFKDGGHNPEKFMEVGELVNVDGLLLPSELKTHWTVENGQPGEYITKIEVTDLHFEKTLESDFFDVPEGAKILE
ncbi:hypothetical protein [Kriegella aquimaris]|uniref:Outer membrane lipoprotein-sorting protein n=1 Tax=Kriegella aquimaris TaxID=192904 RepID=A0A1G9RFK6_9FLAO|nr:hypothetical protein [Kriegella aquimaris]SDM22099.1 hypothetical protein SAMN04488514_106125 [Kriegella aquimaris]